MARAVRSLDEARLRIAFTGLERTATPQSMRLSLAVVLARLGQRPRHGRRSREISDEVCSTTSLLDRVG